MVVVVKFSIDVFKTVLPVDVTWRELQNAFDRDLLSHVVADLLEALLGLKVKFERHFVKQHEAYCRVIRVVTELLLDSRPGQGCPLGLSRGIQLVVVFEFRAVGVIHVAKLEETQCFADLVSWLFGLLLFVKFECLAHAHNAGLQVLLSPGVQLIT